MLPRPLAVILSSLALAISACTGGATAAPDEEAAIGHASLALLDTDPVSAAVGASCTTTIVKGLATQLVAEIQCMRPGSMKSIDGAAGLSLGAAVFPYLQTPAADALLVAQKTRGTTMVIDSALRTLPQQYLLYRWYQTGACGISLAATPGTSNHEGALAVDLEDAQGWRPAMTGAGFHWLGASDPVHFDYLGAGAIDLGGLSVTAFQRLWNRNHPEDVIVEDGIYGPEVASHLARAPIGGFARGADCGTDASAPPAVPDASAAPTPPALAPAVEGAAPPSSSDSGCSVAVAQGVGEASRARTTSLALSLLALVVLAARARRRAATP